ncbi:MAG TPA: LysR family transcriptional regulator [Rhizomicrobium sp.]|nr:LysR family transcriptional regulator [Rhizomicrobium sp.]
MGAMDIQKIRQVIEISRLGSFTRAAKHLGTSQPALSRSIARLEDLLGAPLFERSGEGARPTPLAQYIVSRGDLAIRGIAALEHEARMMAKGSAGRLVLGVGPFVGELLLAPLSERLMREFPQLSLRIVTHYGQDLISLLSERKIDLALAASGDRANNDAEETTGIRAVHLFKSHIHFFTRPDHPLAVRKRRLDRIELLDFPFAGAGLTKQQRDEFPAELTRAQRHNLNAAMIQDNDVVRHLILTTDTIGYGLSQFFLNDIREGRIVRLDVDYEGLHYCEAFTSPESRHSLIVERCIAIAIDLAENMNLDCTPSTRHGRRASGNGSAKLAAVT